MARYLVLSGCCTGLGACCFVKTDTRQDLYRAVELSLFVGSCLLLRLLFFLLLGWSARSPCRHSRLVCLFVCHALPCLALPVLSCGLCFPVCLLACLFVSLFLGFFSWWLDWLVVCLWLGSRARTTCPSPSTRRPRCWPPPAMRRHSSAGRRTRRTRSNATRSDAERLSPARFENSSPSAVCGGGHLKRATNNMVPYCTPLHQAGCCMLGLKFGTGTNHSNSVAAQNMEAGNLFPNGQDKQCPCGSLLTSAE